MQKKSYFLGLNLVALTSAALVQAEADITKVPPAEVTLPVNGQLQAVTIATKAWLDVVDKGEYAKSWDETSKITQVTMSKAEWEKLLNKTRKPLGAVKTRDVVDIRSAENPPKMPAGKYMVMVYKTSFSTKPEAHELVTLFLQDGQWRVLTYQIN